MSGELGLAGASLLSLQDLSDAQMLGLVDFAKRLKEERRQNRTSRQGRLTGRHIALLFEKASTRTRCATVVAAYDEGASAAYLGKNDIHLGKKESVADTARVLGRMFDGIMFRGFAQRTVEQLAEHAGVPVWNGLTDRFHPTQILADLLTVREHFSRLQGLKLVYAGDGRNNVACSLMLGCAKAGMHMVNCCPEELEPAPAWVQTTGELAAANGGSVSVLNDPHEAVQQANVVYTDVWVSMGEEDKYQQRLALLRPYQITMDLMRQAGNLNSDDVIFLHCLPAFHDNNTQMTRETGALEVADEVFEAPFSKVFDQAENRMHTIKAVMVASLNGGR